MPFGRIYIYIYNYFFKNNNNNNTYFGRSYLESTYKVRLSTCKVLYKYETVFRKYFSSTKKSAGVV